MPDSPNTDQPALHTAHGKRVARRHEKPNATAHALLMPEVPQDITHDNGTRTVRGQKDPVSVHEHAAQRRLEQFAHLPGISPP
ncbi:MAG: hypothetical protein ACYDDO_06050 [Acidiferrobacterales bacterium]